MRLLIITCLALVTFSSVCRSEPSGFNFRSIFAFGENQVFSLSAGPGAKASWVAVGDFFEGYQVVDFRTHDKVLVIRKDGEDFLIELATANVRQDGPTPDRSALSAGDPYHEMRILREVGLAAIVFAERNDGRLPVVETIHEFARALAREGGLNHASFWVSEAENSASDAALTGVLSDDGVSLDPAFAKQESFAFDFAAGLQTQESPPTTPIAWTRGLREDGTWDENGPYGSAGGMILFRGGYVYTFKDLHSEGGGVLELPDGRNTSNILEALPPDVRVVGSGQGTLHGSSGRRDVEPLDSTPPDSLP